VLERLLAAGADATVVDAAGAGALHHACMAEVSSADLIQRLLALGLDPAQTDGAGQSAIDLANGNGRGRLLAMLDPRHAQANAMETDASSEDTSISPPEPEVPPLQRLREALRTNTATSTLDPLLARLAPGESSLLLADPDIDLVDDKEGKPVGIDRFIGRRPIAAFGNSDGDLQMLQWTTLGQSGRRFGLIVHHDDATREYAYDRDSHIGRLDEALDAAPAAGWTVVSMKNDWREVFPPP